MNIETTANKALMGKRDKKNPVKAVVGDMTLAVGATAKEAKQKAMDLLIETFESAQKFEAVRFAKDGSVFVGRETGPGHMTYTRYTRNEDGSTKTCGTCCGSMTGGFDTKFTSISRYMDHVVTRYNDVA